MLMSQIFVALAPHERSSHCSESGPLPHEMSPQLSASESGSDAWLWSFTLSIKSFKRCREADVS